MPKRKAIEVQAKVVESLPNTKFRIELENGHEAIVSLSGKLRENRIRVMAEDVVTVQLSPYDLTRGRIIFRRIDGAKGGRRPKPKRR